MQKNIEVDSENQLQKLNCEICEIPFGYIKGKKRICPNCQKSVCKQCYSYSLNDQKLCDLCILKSQYVIGEDKKSDQIVFNEERKKQYQNEIQKLNEQLKIEQNQKLQLSQEIVQHEQETSQQQSNLANVNKQINQKEKLKDELNYSNKNVSDKILQLEQEQLQQINALQNLQKQNETLDLEIQLLEADYSQNQIYFQKIKHKEQIIAKSSNKQ